MNKLHATVIRNQLRRYTDQLQVFREMINDDYKMTDDERSALNDALQAACSNLTSAANEIHDDNRYIRNSGSL